MKNFPSSIPSNPFSVHPEDLEDLVALELLKGLVVGSNRVSDFSQHKYSKLVSEAYNYSKAYLEVRNARRQELHNKLQPTNLLDDLVTSQRTTKETNDLVGYRISYNQESNGKRVQLRCIVGNGTGSFVDWKTAQLIAAEYQLSIPNAEDIKQAQLQRPEWLKNLGGNEPTCWINEEESNSVDNAARVVHLPTGRIMSGNFSHLMLVEKSYSEISR